MRARSTLYALFAENIIGMMRSQVVFNRCLMTISVQAPRVPSKSISDMVVETNIIAKKFSERGWPILAFLDTHEPDKPEVPYPPHCIVGTGEENLVSGILDKTIHNHGYM